MKSALMVVHSYYLDDTRVRREAEALIEDGYNVDVVCLNKGGELETEQFNGVQIFRCDIGRSKERSKLSYIMEYVSFFIRALLKVSKLSWRNNYSVFLAHNMPNFLIFTGVLAKLKGAKLVLDMHDSMPELYINLFNLKDGFLLKLLKFEEWLSVKMADVTMTANLPIADILEERNQKPFHVTHNTPDMKVLGIVERKEKNNKQIKLFHHGNIHKRYGLDRILPHLESLNQIENRFVLEVHGRGPWYDDVKSKAKELDVNDYCYFNGGFKPQDIGQHLATADIGLVLNHKDPLTDLLLPVKMLEYIACGIPVVCPKTEAVTKYFSDDSVYFFESDEEIALAIKSIVDDPVRANEKQKNAFQTYNKMNWSKEKADFVRFINEI